MDYSCQVYVAIYWLIYHRPLFPLESLKKIFFIQDENTHPRLMKNVVLSLTKLLHLEHIHLPNYVLSPDSFLFFSMLFMNRGFF